MITTDYDYLTALEQLRSQQTQKISPELEAAAKAVKEGDDSAAAAFSSMLKKEIDNLHQNSGLGNVLAGSSAMGTTAGLNNISEMLKSESGRKAIGAMADNAITSIVLKDSGDRDDSSSVLDTLTKKDQSSEQELEDALKDVLEILESSGGAEQTQKT